MQKRPKCVPLFFHGESTLTRDYQWELVGSGATDIFQGCMSDPMEDLMYARTYLDDLLIITSGSFSDHLAMVDPVLSRLRDAGLKVNATKSFFCMEETEYLGYVLTRDGIKPQPQKVQAILALKPPTNVKELRTFLGISQYYCDMWEKRSDMLAPLTNLVGECGHTKVTRANN